jgi:hypothetical protein
VKNLFAIVLGAVLLLMSITATAAAGYDHYIVTGFVGNVPNHAGSDTGVGDLDGDGNMEYVVRHKDDGREFLIYDLVTGAQEYYHTADLPTTIHYIHIVPTGEANVVVALLQCEAGDTYMVAYDPLSGIELGESTPGKVNLRNSPNPFPESTEIGFCMSRPGHVNIRVFDVSGREIRQVELERADAGEHSVRWDGCDNSGIPVSPGTYFYSLSVDGRLVRTGKAVTIR